MKHPEMLDAALWYARHGFPVYPTKNKRPIYRNIGCYGATTDPKKITKWYTEHPDAQIAIPTGSNTRLFVLDLDNKGGKNGIETYKARFGGLPDTIGQTTPNNGLHYLFRYPDDLDPEIVLKTTVSSLLGQGIDTKGEGGSFTACPSAGYQWLEKFAASKIKPVPQCLTDLFIPKPKDLRPRPAVPVTHGTNYQKATMAGIIAQLEEAVEGVNRNNTLNALAYRIGKLVKKNKLDESAIYDLELAALNIGLTKTETAATIKSGYSAGLRDG
jgi:hypothetical protein